MCHRVMGSNVWETSCAFGAHFGVPHSPLHLAALQPCSQRSPPCRGALCWAPPRLSPPPLPAPVVTLPTARSPSAWGSAASAGSTPTSTPRGCCACGPAWSSRHGSDGVSPPSPPCRSPSSSPLSPSLLPTVLYSPRGSPPTCCPTARSVVRSAILGSAFLFGTASCPPGTQSRGCSWGGVLSSAGCFLPPGDCIPGVAGAVPNPHLPALIPSQYQTLNPVPSVGTAHCSSSYFPPQNPAGSQSLGGYPRHGDTLRWLLSQHRSRMRGLLRRP